MRRAVSARRCITGHSGFALKSRGRRRETTPAGLEAEKAPVLGPKILEFFSRQPPRNPIERPKTGTGPDNGVGSPVQKNFKKLKKNLVRLQTFQ
jgi:hypothetical protein